MKEVDPGHEYLLDSYDGEQINRLVFMKREGEGYPFNVGHHPGTNCQEVLRALIARVKYLQRQIPCEENERVINNLRSCLWEFEKRAAHRHGRASVFPWQEQYQPVPIEERPPCAGCGHVGCEGNHKSTAAIKASSRELVCACRTFALDPITRAYLDDCDFVHTVTACPETKLNAATPPDTPSDAAMRAAEEIVPDCLSRTCFIRDSHRNQCWGCDDSRKERERVAAIITRHLAHSLKGDQMPSTQQQFTWTMNYLLYELTAYLDTLTITSDNIGDVRRSLFVPWESRWNGIVREQTADRELSPDATATASPERGREIFDAGFASPETPVGGEPRMCLKCGHNNVSDGPEGTSIYGMCIEPVKESAEYPPNIVACGCKCEFNAPVATTADKERNDKP